MTRQVKRSTKKEHCACKRLFRPCSEIMIKKTWKLVEPKKKNGSYQLVLYHTSKPHLERDLDRIIQGLKLLRKQERKKRK